MEAGMIFRSHQPGDEINIDLIDLENNNTWETIGIISAWSWQKGCMLRWIPGSEEVTWKDRDGDNFISRVYNIKTDKQRVLPKPVYTLIKDGSFGLGVDFARLQYYQPGYGYVLKQVRDFRTQAPDDTGIYRMDLQTGESKLILSYTSGSQYNHSYVRQPVNVKKHFYGFWATYQVLWVI